MATTDDELKAIFTKGYTDWWASDEARTGRTGARRDNAAGYRAVFEAGRREGAVGMQKAVDSLITNKVIHMNNDGLRLAEPEWSKLRDECDLLLDTAKDIRALPAETGAP